MIKLISENILLCILLLNSSISFCQEPDNIKIGIVHSGLTKQLLYKHDNSFYPILDWELFFLNCKLKYEVIDDEGLDNYNFKGLDVLIFPSVEILSERAIDNLKDYLSSGKSLFVSGKMGNYDQELNRRKPDALEFLTGLKTFNIPERELISENLQIYNSNILTQNLKEDLKFLILNQPVPLYAKEIMHYGKSLGRYFTVNFKSSCDNACNGIIAIEKEDRKVLWFGFQLSQISLNADERKNFHDIVLNGIKWLAGKPMVWVNRFPSFYQSAALFSIWIKKIRPSAVQSAALFALENVPVNFFISPEGITHSFDELGKYSSAGDVNLLFDEFDYLDIGSEQMESVFREASKILKGESRQELFGVQFLNSDNSLPYGYKIDNYFDFFLTQDLKLYYLNDEKELPAAFKIIPNYINNLKGLNVEGYFLKLSDSLHNEAVKTGKVLLHICEMNYNQSISESQLEIISQLVRRAKKEKFFITTWSELVNWYSQIEDIEVKIIEASDEPEFIIEVENSATKIIEQVGLNICIPPEYRSVRLSSYDFPLTYNVTSGYYNLLIPFLRAGQKLTLELEYWK